MIKNGIEQVVHFYLHDAVNNTGKTGEAGNLTMQVVGDGIMAAADNPGSIAEIDFGLYEMTLSIAESLNKKFIGVGGVCSTANIHVIPAYQSTDLLYKGIAYIGLVTIWDDANNVPRTGETALTLTMKVAQDSTDAGATNAPAEIDAVNLPGVYSLSVTAAEGTGNAVSIFGGSSTADTTVLPTELSTFTRVGSCLQLDAWDNWTLDSGLTSEDSRLSMSRYAELFDGYTIDTANIEIMTNANGKATQVGGALRLYSPTAVDAASFYYKTAVNVAQADVTKLRESLFEIVDINYPLLVVQGITGALPLVNDMSASVLVTIRADDVFRIEYRDTGGTTYRWNETTGAWTTSAVDIPTGVDYTHGYDVRLVKTSTTWVIKIKDMNTGVTIADTAPVPIAWSNTLDNGKAYYIASGDPFTSFARIQGMVTELSTNYPLSAVQATMDALTLNGGMITDIPFVETNAEGATITYDYNIGAGWVTGLTLSQLTTVLLATTPATLQLRVSIVSDTEGDAQAYVDITDRIIVTTPVTTVTGPLEITEIETLEVIEL